jgi:hypothetical protein
MIVGGIIIIIGLIISIVGSIGAFINALRILSITAKQFWGRYNSIYTLKKLFRIIVIFLEAVLMIVCVLNVITSGSIAVIIPSSKTDSAVKVF